MELKFNNFKTDVQYLKTVVRQFRDERRNRVVIVGDDMLEGLDPAVFLPEFRMMNMAIKGDATSSLIATIDLRVLNKRPLAIIIATGTSDIDRQMKYAVSQTNIEYLISYLKGVTTVPIALCLIAPVAPSYDKSKLDVIRVTARSNRRINRYNKMLREIAAKFEIAIIDTHEPLTADHCKELAHHFTDNGVDLNRKAIGMVSQALLLYLYRIPGAKV